MNACGIKFDTIIFVKMGSVETKRVDMDFQTDNKIGCVKTMDQDTKRKFGDIETDGESLKSLKSPEEEILLLGQKCFNDGFKWIQTQGTQETHETEIKDITDAEKRAKEEAKHLSNLKLVRDLKELQGFGLNKKQILKLFPLLKDIVDVLIPVERRTRRKL